MFLQAITVPVVSFLRAIPVDSGIYIELSTPEFSLYRIVAMLVVLMVVHSLLRSLACITLFESPRFPVMSLGRFVLGGFNQLTEVLRSAMDDLGSDTVSLAMPGADIQVISRDPVLFNKMVLDKDFDIGESIRGCFTALYPRDVFLKRGAAHRHHRSALKGHLFSRNTSDQHMDSLGRDLATVLKSWSSQGAKGESFDVINDIFYLSYRRACRLFVSDYDTIEDAFSMENMQSWVDFHTDFSKVLAAYSLPQVMPLLGPLVAQPYIMRMKSQSKQFRQRIVKFLNNEKGFKAEHEHTLAASCLAAGYDAEVVADQVEDAMVASYNEMIALCCVIFELSKHPEVLRRVQEEVDAAFPDVGSLSDDGFSCPKLSMDLLEKLPFCTAVMKEVLRLHPPVQATVRTALVDRYGVSKGQTVMLSIALMHRDTRLWGDDAEEFRPERWFEPRPDLCKTADGKNVRRYAPFGNGAHMCLGQHVSQVCILSSMAMMFRFLDISNDKQRPVQLEITPQLSVGPNGMKIYARERFNAHAAA